MFVPNAVQNSFIAAGEMAETAYVVAVSGPGALCDQLLTLPLTSDLKLPAATPLLRIGTLEGIPCCVCRLAGAAEYPVRFQLTPGRVILANGPAGVREALCRGREMLLWREQHRFCGCCAGELTPSTQDLALCCPKCGALYFPQIAPAVIVAITRAHGDELLLAHNRRFADGVFSLIAGFVEAGESAESAVHREIREETGIEVGHIRYLISQPWPFPNSLMLAFTAEHSGGEARADGTELSECRWFRREALPLIPNPGSIARKVIDLFASGALKGEGDAVV